MVKWIRRTELVDAALSLLERGWHWILLFLGAAGTGGAAGWAAAASGWLNVYGPVSWVLATLFGVFLFTLIAWAIASLRVRLAERRILRIHEISPPPFNPMDDTFTRRQILIQHFAKPLPQSNDGKSFINCEIFGPSVVFFGDNSTLIDNTVLDCDFVVVKNGAMVKNVIFFKNATIRRCTLYNLTILIPPVLAQQIEDASPGANWITEIPDS